MSQSHAAKQVDDAFVDAVRNSPDEAGNWRGWWVTVLGAPAIEAVISGLDANQRPDWLGLDLQHGALEETDVAPILRVTQPLGLPVLVRLRGSDPQHIARVLDAGPAGIIVPSIGSAEQAEAVVRAALTPPRGERSTGLARAGFALTPSPTPAPLVIVMIETVGGYAARQEIAQVAGIDAIFVGPYDLSLSLGLTSPTEPDVVAAIAQVLAGAKEHGLATGYFAGDPELVASLPPVDVMAADSDVAVIRAGLMQHDGLGGSGGRH